MGNELEKISKNNLLDIFYEHVSEQDWLDGVDYYQGGKVTDLSVFDGLLTSKVLGLHASYEVRIKIHPSGHQIQWIECTCSKNRKRNIYCEHITAFMLHIDREAPKLLGPLTKNMPLKPPIGAKRVRVAAKKEEEKTQQTARARILEHLNQSIHSVNLVGRGPSLRVRVEIKEGQLTHYDLALDDAAKFLTEKKKLKTASDDVKKLKVYKQDVILGTRLYQSENEEIIAERVIGIKHTPKSADKIEEINKIPTVLERAKLFLSKETKAKESLYEFIPIKNGVKLLGENYFFFPERGYWPINREALTSDWHELPLQKKYKGDQVAKLIASEFEQYLSLGPIWLDEHLKEPTVIEIPKLTEIKVHAEQDGWFTLDPQYGHGDSSVAMVDLIRQFISKKRDYHKTGKSWIKIPELVKQFDWEFDESGKYLKVDSIGLHRLKAAMGEFDQFAGSKKIINQIRNRVEFSPPKQIPSLADSKLNLRDYQTFGLKWLWWLYNNGLHGLLADEMGLGKTHQAMALLTCIRKEKPDAKFLVISPTTVLDHWLDKVVDFCPNLDPIKHHGPKRDYKLSFLETGINTVITSYGVLLRDIKSMSQMQWDAVILDEAHFVKNNATATYAAVCRLNANIRICLTGTPMENTLSELKNVFDFLVPGYLGSDDYFKKNFIKPMEKAPNEDDTTEIALQKLIHPFKMRRTKDQVLDDLPAKVEDVRHCALSDEQVKMYRDIIELKASPLLKQLEDGATPVPFLHVFATLTLLKQLCDHPALVHKSTDYKKYESGKFNLLKELLDEALASDHKVVIYSQYVSMIDIICRYLTDSSIEFVSLTGQTRNRGKIIKKFQEDPNTKIFVGSLLAGGIGIDLTSASVVIHYDRWWNASKENQATDRVHRIGQNKNVQVLKLITRGTLEEKIDSIIKSKQKLFERFLEKDEEIFKTLSRQEMIDLLH